eukprot:4615603-Karenia_brevis.AAC.1
MNTQADFLGEVFADVFALQEVRLSEVGQRDMTESLRDGGWQCFGAALKSHSIGLMMHLCHRRGMPHMAELE